MVPETERDEVRAEGLDGRIASIVLEMDCMGKKKGERVIIPCHSG